MSNKLMHSPALNEIPVYVRNNVGLSFVSVPSNVYIFYLIPGGKKEKVTSGGTAEHQSI
jgi:hypothetical protein